MKILKKQFRTKKIRDKKRKGLRDMLKTCPFRPRLPHLGHFHGKTIDLVTP